MSTLGRYNLLVSDEGTYAVEWQEKQKYFLVKLPKLMSKIDEMVEQELKIRKHFAEIFNLAFHDGDRFIEHPDSIILNYLENSEVSAPSTLSKNQLLEFNIRQFLLAYNRWKSTSLKLKEVRDLCFP